MEFHSYSFPVFVGVAALLYYRLPAAWRMAYLAVLSFLFYMLWSVKYAVLLLAATFLVFWIARRVESGSEQRKYREAFLGVVFLVIILGIFKYGDFLTRIFSPDVVLLQVIAPVGISYYTFKLISYLVDVYSGKIAAEKNFAAFAAYTAFFPQILAGPIQRASDFLPEIRAAKGPDPEKLTSGLRLILFGLFKKLVVADALGLWVNYIYQDTGSYSGFSLFIASYLFAIQLYADFSGIIDIARGSARLLMIESPKNFENPFYAPTIQEFWRRWHMTLTSWLADYVFLPIRMKFRYWGTIGLLLAIFINMVLIGLWHGASATFLMFGIVQAAYMILSVLTLKRRNAFFQYYDLRGRKIHKIVGWTRRIWQPVVTFTLVSLSLIFFRAESFLHAKEVFSEIFSPSLLSINTAELLKAADIALGDTRLIVAILGIVVMEIIHLAGTHEHLRVFLFSRPIAVRWGMYYAMIIAILFFGEQSTRPFIYFQF